MNRKAFRVAAPVGLCVLALLVAGCGGGREYAVPKKLCDIPVGEEVSPLLSDGEELDMVGGPLATSTHACSVSVDHYPAVSVQVDRTEKFYDPMDELHGFRFTNRKKMSPLPFDGAGAMGDENVMITARCGAPSADHLVVNFIFGDRAEKDVDRRRADMEKFVLAFVPALKEKVACTA